MLLQVLSTTFSKSELFSCLQKVDHVTNYIAKGLFDTIQTVIVFFNPSYELVPCLQHYSGLFNKSTTIFHGLKIVVDLFFYTKIESFDVHFLYSCSENRVSEKDKNKLHHPAISMVCTLMKHIALDQSVSFVREIA